MSSFQLRRWQSPKCTTTVPPQYADWEAHHDNQTCLIGRPWRQTGQGHRQYRQRKTGNRPRGPQLAVSVPTTEVRIGKSRRDLGTERVRREVAIGKVRREVAIGKVRRGVTIGKVRREVTISKRLLPAGRNKLERAYL